MGKLNSVFFKRLEDTKVTEDVAKKADELEHKIAAAVPEQTPNLVKESVATNVAGVKQELGEELKKELKEALQEEATAESSEPLQEIKQTTPEAADIMVTPIVSVTATAECVTKEELAKIEAEEAAAAAKDAKEEEVEAPVEENLEDVETEDEYPVDEGNDEEMLRESDEAQEEVEDVCEGCGCKDCTGCEKEVENTVEKEEVSDEELEAKAIEDIIGFSKKYRKAVKIVLESVKDACNVLLEGLGDDD